MLKVKVNQEAFKAALAFARHTLADKDSRRDAFKCFRFHEGTIQTYNGQEGTSIGFHEIEGIDCLVYGEKLWSLVSSRFETELDLTLTDSALKIETDDFIGSVPIHAIPDFPNLLEGDMEDIYPGGGLLGALGLASNYAKKSTSLKAQVVQIRGKYAYGTDTTRHIRVSLPTQAVRHIALPLYAVQKIERLGEPTMLFATANGGIGALYEDRAAFYVTREMDIPDLTRVVDRILDELEDDSRKDYVFEVPEELVAAVKRVHDVAPNHGPVFVGLEGTALVVSYMSEEVIIREKVKAPLGGSVGCFKTSITRLHDALSFKPTHIDLSDVCLNDKPKAIRLIGDNWQQVVALSV